MQDRLQNIPRHIFLSQLEHETALVGIVSTSSERRICENLTSRGWGSPDPWTSLASCIPAAEGHDETYL